MEADSGAPIREQLATDEHLVWSGQPPQGIRLRSGDLLLIPFSLMWGGFAIFWEWMVVRADAPLLFKLWGVPFVVVGIYMILGRFFWDAYQRRNTYYGLSDQRVVIVTRGAKSKVKSLSLKSLVDISFEGRSSGGGTIQFGSTPGNMPGWLVRSGWPGAQVAPMFELSSDAKQVYEMIRQTQRRAT